MDLVKNTSFGKKQIVSMVLNYYKDLQKKEKLSKIQVSFEKSCINDANWISDKIDKMDNQLTYHKMFNTKICGSEYRNIGEMGAKELLSYRKWRKECNLVHRIVTPNEKKKRK